MNGSSDSRRKLTLLLVSIALGGMMGGLFETTFNNYLADAFTVATQTRSRLELPREMPGFLVTLLAGSLTMLALNRVGLVAMFVSAAGLAGLAFAQPSFGLMVASMITYSAGMHLNMPTRDSMTLALASKDRPATLLGRAGAADIMGVIAGATLVAVGTKSKFISYSGVYLVASAAALASGMAFLLMGRVERRDQPRRKVFVLKRRYGLYYVLCTLYGARKQVFITFGPWLLIKVFGQEAHVIAKLWIAACLLGLGVRPLVGLMIDKWGERRALTIEGCTLAGVCATYAIAATYRQAAAALYFVMGAYIVDQMCFALSMARTTYLSKIIENREDLPGGLAAGISIDHFVAMTIPTAGGLLWVKLGPQYVFIAAGAVALSYALTSRLVKVPAAPLAVPPAG